MTLILFFILLNICINHPNLTCFADFDDYKESEEKNKENGGNPNNSWQRWLWHDKVTILRLESHEKTHLQGKPEALNLRLSHEDSFSKKLSQGYSFKSIRPKPQKKPTLEGNLYSWSHTFITKATPWKFYKKGSCSSVLRDFWEESKEKLFGEFLKHFPLYYKKYY